MRNLRTMKYLERVINARGFMGFQPENLKKRHNLVDLRLYGGYTRTGFILAQDRRQWRHLL
jgi:hypothetical protein